MKNPVFYVFLICHDWVNRMLSITYKIQTCVSEIVMLFGRLRLYYFTFTSTTYSDSILMISVKEFPFKVLFDGIFDSLGNISIRFLR